MRLIIFFFLLTVFPHYQIAANEHEYFLMLKNSKVNVRYGPSREDQIKFIYRKKNLPLKVIDKKENFRKITDHKNNSGWIHISQLRKSKSLVLMKEDILFKKKTKFSDPIAKLAEGKLVLIKKCQENWCKVKADEFIGWLELNNVWGIKINNSN